MRGYLTLTLLLCSMLLLICSGCTWGSSHDVGGDPRPAGEPPSIISVVGPGIFFVDDTEGLESYTGYPGHTEEFWPNYFGSPATSFSWDFGGGGTPDTSQVERPRIALTTPGSFNCSVTLTNAHGSDRFDFELLVHAAPPPIISGNGFIGPGIGTVMRATSLVSGLQYESFGEADLSGFDLTFAPPARLWTWDFGGGCTPNTASSVLEPVVVTMGAPGTYNGTLTCTTGGGSDSLEFEYTVVAE